jgi:hypothetical protein
VREKDGLWAVVAQYPGAASSERRRHRAGALADLLAA